MNEYEAMDSRKRERNIFPIASYSWRVRVPYPYPTRLKIIYISACRLRLHRSVMVILFRNHNHTFFYIPIIPVSMFWTFVLLEHIIYIIYIIMYLFCYSSTYCLIYLPSYIIKCCYIIYNYKPVVMPTQFLAVFSY